MDINLDFFFQELLKKKINFQELITPQYQMRAHREDVCLFDSQEYSTILLRTVVVIYNHEFTNLNFKVLQNFF